jgi:type IV secretory pathway VirB2 component (pilin)
MIGGLIPTVKNILTFIYFFLYSLKKMIFIVMNNIKKLFLYLFFFIVFTLPVLAADDPENAVSNSTDLEGYICKTLKFLTGGVGKGLASFCCIGISLGFIAGKLAWTTVLTFTIGMACIFGAPQIVRAFSGTTVAACDNYK